jgi:hypothetical protein
MPILASLALLLTALLLLLLLLLVVVGVLLLLMIVAIGCFFGLVKRKGRCHTVPNLQHNSAQIK